MNLIVEGKMTILSPHDYRVSNLSLKKCVAFLICIKVIIIYDGNVLKMNSGNIWLRI